MTKLTSAAAAVGIALTMWTPGTAAAEPADSTLGAAQMPFQARLRACDFTLLKWVDARGDARPFAQVSAADGTVTANVVIATALPDTHYDVRVIQTPRPSSGCGPGAPGVIAGSLQTDGVGAGGVSLRGPVANGATGAWVVIERPAPNSQTPAEFYSTDYVASF
jgi:hypothetical protein